MSSSSTHQWTIILVLTAILLSLVVTFQVLSKYGAAYFAAPKEISTFIDSIDSSIQENESYDSDVAKVPRLEEKLRLSRLLREIQKGGDDLRECLNGLLLSEEDTRPKMSARILWASKRADLEERLRRLDLLRMRFLVIYMSIVAATTTAAAEKVEKSASPKDPEKAAHHPPARQHSMPAGLMEGIKRKPPLRRLTTQAMGHHDSSEGGHRRGWAGVVQELQMSPLMHKRHASIEMAMAQPPQTP
ncbi:uncharacterized protein E0L32_012083 [Thyridium curvatum]|uniref:Uncharacterized protein n=1 Tax=Thyridium curvatum TaxID=1093900 RepID=A0A507BDI2_9PEZI|nr:uncharacterized protein E0L32_012083 [Thyridium curvatum]TPX17603.1 hypothetical protein E0L32_012083 [Thyridium curvatum]